MDKLTAMRYFCRVVEHGGFAAAARSLGTTRATISKYVVSLEDELGVPLLLRSTRKVSPTDAGLGFYQRAVKILEDLEEAEARASVGREVPSGRLRVNAPLPFGVRYLGPYLCEYVQEYDQVEVQLDLSDRFIDLFDEDYDLTIRISDVQESANLVVKEICPVRIVLCAAPAYLRARGQPETPAALADHACLHFGPFRTGRRWVLGGQAISPSGPVSTNNADVLLAAALGGLGICALPSFMVADEIRAGRLRAVLGDHPLESRSLQAIYPFHRQVSSKLTSFVNGLIDRFSAPPWEHP